MFKAQLLTIIKIKASSPEKALMIPEKSGIINGHFQV
jgi:hypothetical protein